MWQSKTSSRTFLLVFRLCFCDFFIWWMSDKCKSANDEAAVSTEFLSVVPFFSGLSSAKKCFKKFCGLFFRQTLSAAADSSSSFKHVQYFILFRKNMKSEWTFRGARDVCCFMWNCVRFFMLFMYSKVFSSSRRFSECWGNVQIILGAVPRFAAFVAEKGCAALKLIIFHNNFLLHKVPLIAILRYRTRRLQPFRFVRCTLIRPRNALYCRKNLYCSIRQLWWW